MNILRYIYPLVFLRSTMNIFVGVLLAYIPFISRNIDITSQIIIALAYVTIYIEVGLFYFFFKKEDVRHFVGKNTRAKETPYPRKNFFYRIVSSSVIWFIIAIWFIAIDGFSNPAIYTAIFSMQVVLNLIVSAYFLLLRKYWMQKGPLPQPPQLQKK